MNVIRGLIRPLLTVLIVLAYLWAYLHPWLYTAEHTGLLFAPAMLVLGFWFGERALRNLGMNLGAALQPRVSTTATTATTTTSNTTETP
jgi:hypothetical protein